MKTRQARRRWRAIVQQIAVVLLVLTLVCASGATAGLDRWFHDTVVRLQPRPPHPDIVIVAIDDKSLSALGRWPWSRSTHAQLIDRLSEAGARVVGIDLLLLEPDRQQPAHDLALSRALARSGRVVLPAMMQEIGGVATRVAPLPLFADHALAIGHVHLPVDNDGVVRRVYLTEGTATHKWDHLARALQRQGNDPSTGPDTLPPTVASDGTPWQRLDPMGIAYAGPPGHFRQLSYVDVLDKRFAADTFKDKWVLVGVTAAGLGDLFATPVAHQETLMPGVEINAHVLDSLLSARGLTPASPALTWAFNLVPLLLVWGTTRRRVSPQGWLGQAVAAVSLCALAAGAAQHLAGLQVSPWPALFAVAVCGLLYWLWQWHLSRRDLTAELQRFRSPSGLLAGPDTHPLTQDPAHGLPTLRELTQQLRDVHRFVRDSLDALPDATLVCAVDSHIQLANAASANLAMRLGGLPHTQVALPPRGRPGDALLGMPLITLLQVLRFANDNAVNVARRIMQLPAQAVSLAASSTLGRDYLVRCVPTHSARERHTGWIVSLIDVTDIQRAQRQRDEAIGFLSHDMRAPQSSILSLLELRRTRPDSLSAAQFEERVERHARKALALSDGFIQLARAQSREYVLQTHNLVELVEETLDDAWERAQQRRIALRRLPGPEQASGQLDRELLGRAITNLLGNAIKFSPEGATVEAGVRAEPGHWVVVVRDQGPGISPEAQAHLFEPFFRDPSAQRIDGAGLGLPFVQAVMRGHGGRVEVHSQPGHGARFELWLPHRVG